MQDHAGLYEKCGEEVNKNAVGRIYTKSQTCNFGVKCWTKMPKHGPSWSRTAPNSLIDPIWMKIIID